jgi:aminopeptidase N
MHRTMIATIVLVIAGFAAIDSVPAASAEELVTTQLPRNVRPSHYSVAVTPDAAKLQFKGHVIVDIDVLQPTTSITLNALDMVFSKVDLASADGKVAMADPRVTIDADAQTATFLFDKPIAPDSYKLAMDYTGKIGTQANGLFAIDYDTRAGKKRALYTQFENSDARRFIPSWDEPAYKATFSLEAVVPSADGGQQHAGRTAH